MRLPPFFCALSPLGETLAAIRAGESLLVEAAAERNAQLSVSTAEAGLSLWEKDYALASDGSLSARRARILAALAGGRTLTPEHLAQLAVSVGGADRGDVEEAFSEGRVTLYALYKTTIPNDLSSLEEATQRLKPAHLTVDVVPTLLLQGSVCHHAALCGTMYLELRDTEADEE